MQGSVSSDRRAVTDKLRVVVVDDHEVARRGITDLLNEADDITVVGQASTAEQALARVAVLLPDVAVLDVRLPDGSGVDVCRELRSRCPQVQCLMLTSFPDEQTMLDAFLVGAVRSVGSGRSLLDPLAAAVLVGRLRSAAPPPGPLAGLTDHERTTLELIGEGLTNRQIAGRMFVAEKTVKNYVSHLLAKLGMGTRTQIAVLATQVRANQAEASQWADPGSRSGAPRTPRPGERTGR